MPDISGIVNPKRTLADREEEAERMVPAASAPKSDYAKKFSKPFTPEERAKQAEALEMALRNRK